MNVIRALQLFNWDLVLSQLAGRWLWEFSPLAWRWRQPVIRKAHVHIPASVRRLRRFSAKLLLRRDVKS
jgi:hypothetical protein